METYNKNEHRDLIVNHIKESFKSGLELDMTHIPPRNDGTPLVCIVLDEEGHSIVMESEEFQEIFDEVFAGAEYYRTMTDYITQLQNDFFTGFRCRQDTSVDPMASSRMIRALKEYKR